MGRIRFGGIHKVAHLFLKAEIRSGDGPHSGKRLLLLFGEGGCGVDGGGGAA